MSLFTFGQEWKLGLIKDKGVDKYLKQLSDQKDEL